MLKLTPAEWLEEAAFMNVTLHDPNGWDRSDPNALEVPITYDEMKNRLHYSAVITGPKENKPRVLVIGHGRHGKDTVGEMLRDMYDMKFTSSSWFCLEETIWDNWGCAVYASKDECYADRSNHRTLWAQMISAYNIPNKTNTASTMLKRGYDMYVGMRMKDELDACLERHVFDSVVWVDRSEHLPEEPYASMQLKATDADYFLDNNGTLEELRVEVNKYATHLGIAAHPDV